MNTHLLRFSDPIRIQQKYVYSTLIFTYVFYILYVFWRYNYMQVPEASDIKIWILAGVLGVLMGIIAYFAKKTLESSERRFEQLQEKLSAFNDKLSTHNEHIARILERHEFLGHRVTNCEKRLDTPKS